MSNDLKIDPYLHEVDGQSFQIKEQAIKEEVFNGYDVWSASLCFVHLHMQQMLRWFFSFKFENNCNLIPDPSPSTSLF